MRGPTSNAQTALKFTNNARCCLLPIHCDILIIMDGDADKPSTTQPVVEKVEQTFTPVGQVGGKSKMLMKKFPKDGKKGNLMVAAGALVVILMGVGTGWFMSGGISGSTTASTPTGDVAPGAEESATEAGFEDEATFPDEAEGLLVEGGINGEGTHRLDRQLGPEKDVYLLSTVIDLQSFVDRKVMVWGETIAAKEAGWLMDVGKIKVIE